MHLYMQETIVNKTVKTVLLKQNHGVSLMPIRSGLKLLLKRTMERSMKV